MHLQVDAITVVSMGIRRNNAQLVQQILIIIGKMEASTVLNESAIIAIKLDICKETMKNVRII